MRAFSSSLQSALLARQIVFRDFLWIVARNRETGAPVPAGLWSDVGAVAAPVINPVNQQPEMRHFEGAGALVSISDIPAVSNLTVQNVTVTMSQLHDRVEQLLRLYDVKRAPVQIFSGYCDPDTRKLIEPAFCRFIGFVDKVEFRTPTENEDGAAVLTCVSHTQELTRANPDTRSHDSQELRAPTDGFYKDTASVGEWNIDWGQKGKEQKAPGNFLNYIANAVVNR